MYVGVCVELYYAGEDSSKGQMPRSFTCPFCSRMGFSDATLNTHVNSEHAEDSFEVVSIARHGALCGCVAVKFNSCNVYIHLNMKKD